MDKEHIAQELHYYLKFNKKLHNFARWLYAEIQPFLQGNILEIGSGLGSYSERFVEDVKNKRIILSDSNSYYVAYLKKRFKMYPQVTCLRIDATKPSAVKGLKEKIHTIIALNVLEHIQDDVHVLKNLYTIIEERGGVILLVPAHKFLFNAIDSAVGHYRRYTKKELINKIAQTKFQIKALSYFNFFGMIGWYIHGLFKNRMNEKAMLLFEYLIPLFQSLERNIIRKTMGTSLLVVLEKGREPDA